MAQATTPFVEFDRFTKSFDTGTGVVTAVNEMSFELERGSSSPSSGRAAAARARC